MSEILKEAFQKAVERFVQEQVQVYPATVKAVSELTCTVVLNEGSAEYDDVRLRGFDDDEEGGLIVYPKVGSSCLVGIVDGEFGEFYLVHASQVQGFSYREDDTEIRFDKDGATLKRSDVQVTVGEEISVKTSGAEVKVGEKVSIKAGGANLKEVIDGLLAVLKAPGNYQASTFSVIPLPDTLIKLTKVETKLSQLLE